MQTSENLKSIGQSLEGSIKHLIEESTANLIAKNFDDNKTIAIKLIAKNTELELINFSIITLEDQSVFYREKSLAEKLNKKLDYVLNEWFNGTDDDNSKTTAMVIRRILK